MKHKIFAFLALLLTLAAACAGAQQRPGIGCFSPGLVRVSEKMKENPTVSADVTLTVENAFYARNLSVLKKMLEGTTLRVWGDDARGGLTLERGGETLMQADVAQDGRISVDGHPLEIGVSVPDEAQADWNALAERLQTTPILERVPLTAVEAWLKGLKAGDVLGFGATAADAFDVKRTMSDDGERLTKLNVEGALTIEGETWTVSGYLRQPGGRAPKDTFELTFRKDDKNVVELAYSALRQDKVEQKDRKGQTSVATTLKASGKLEKKGSVKAELSLNNYGFSAPYNLESGFAILDENNNPVKTVKAGTPTDWHSRNPINYNDGKLLTHKVTANCPLPDKAGRYKLAFYLKNPLGVGAQLANDIPFENGYNILETIEIG